MSLPLELISTDFDGTLYAEFENPPIAPAVVDVIGRLQRAGAKWVINTGRDMASLMEAMARSKLEIKPDYLVLVEREIHVHRSHRYEAMEDWNDGCTRAHAELFQRIKPSVPRLIDWIDENFDATIYSDAWSPLCLTAQTAADAEAIHDYLDEFCRAHPDLVVVRNDVWARFSHSAYNKGTSLKEIARRLDIDRSRILVAGDHLNDLPMLTGDVAKHIVTPANGVPAVAKQVREQGGHVSDRFCGHGVADGIERALQKVGWNV
jgi:hydroxymethylpyrimidine pyrophosphatase-like HAD family hydrolase